MTRYPHPGGIRSPFAEPWWKTALTWIGIAVFLIVGLIVALIVLLILVFLCVSIGDAAAASSTGGTAAAVWGLVAAVLILALVATQGGRA